MKPWEEDLEKDEDDPRIQAIITIAYVTAISLACTFVLFFILGLLWPYVERWM